MENNIQETRFKVLEFIRRGGPVLPVQISREIGSNLIMAGAVLSELLRNKQINISSAKVGSSPVYYVNGQETKLSMLYKYLNEKERKVYDLLKKKKVLMDKKLEPYQRVALRELKDFAKMIKVNDQDIFWRWYLIDNQEAGSLVKNLLNIKEPKKKEIKEEKQIKLEPETVVKLKKVKTSKSSKDDVLTNVMQYFVRKNVRLLKHKVVKKNK